MPEPVAETSESGGYEGAFVPPVADQPERRAPRMPQIEDFPLIAQKELRAKTAPTGAPAPRQGGRAEDEGHHPHHDERRRPGLLQRIASVGLGRREESDDSEAIEPPSVVAAQPVEPVSEYAKRPQRPAQPEQPRHQPQVANAPRRGPAVDEDQYDIPAFLRRQAN